MVTNIDAADRAIALDRLGEALAELLPAGCNALDACYSAGNGFSIFLHDSAVSNGCAHGIGATPDVAFAEAHARLLIKRDANTSARSIADAYFGPAAMVPA